MCQVVVGLRASQYYLEQVIHLKFQNPRNWWQHIKQLSGAVDVNIYYDCIVTLTRNDEHINNDVLPDVLNEFFLFQSLLNIHHLT